MKNRFVSHDFQAIGAEDVGYGEIWAKVRCRKCLEGRTIGAPIAEVNILGGCLREGSEQPWQQGDLLVTAGGTLDQFEALLESGRVLSYNAGGHWHESDAADVRPW